MPRKKVVITYICDICHHEHTTKENALACEARGLAIPEFKRHEVVRLAGLPNGSEEIHVSSGFQFNVRDGAMLVISDNGRDEIPNPHMLPYSYDAWIQTHGRPAGDHREIVGGIPRTYLRKASIRSGAVCPLCGSATQQVKQYLVGLLGLGDGFPPIKKVPMHECQRCKIEFFSDDQLKNAESKVRSRTKWPIADTHHLIRKDQFE